MNEVQIIAESAFKSGLYKMTKERIFMLVLLGKDLGLPLTMALSGGIHVIQEKAVLSSIAMNFLIRKSGHQVIVEAISNDGCKLRGIRKDTGQSQENVFTVQDAEKAGLLHKDSWKKHPQDMLYARCLSQLARRLFPDVIYGAYVEGELDDRKAEDALNAPEQIEAQVNLPVSADRQKLIEKTLIIFEENPAISKAMFEKYEAIENMRDDILEAMIKRVESLKKEIDHENN